MNYTLVGYNKLKNIIAGAIMIVIPRFVIAQDNLDTMIDKAIKPIVDALGSVIFFKPFEAYNVHLPMVVIWLIVGATIFTISFRFINIRLFKMAIDIVRGKYDKEEDRGEVSHFQALFTALSGTVGLGNIAGVAVAISIGGAGATFWMIVAGLLGMTPKFIECTLGVKYRHIAEDGVVSGGPMYYLREGLAKQNKALFGKFLAVLFAILCIGGSFGGGNMFQANQSFAQMSHIFPVLNGNGFWFGCTMAIMVGIVIIGGIKKIAKVADKMVPIMVGIYLITGIIIILMNINQLDDAFFKIIHGAFTANALFGGAAGSMAVGFQRAAFSNEAGMGSSTIAHSAVKTEEPITEGLVSLLEPFIDTVVICTMTALILIFTQSDTINNGLQGAELASYAFSSVFPWFKYILTISIVLFAYSTMISWSYYGEKAWSYLFGNSKKSEIVFKLLFLCFIVIGASASLGAVIDFSDMMILSLSIPNMLGLYFLAPEIKKDLQVFLQKIKSN